MRISSKITNFFVYSFGQSINLISPLIVTPYLIKVCSEDGLGKIGIAFSICLILNCIVDYSSYLNGTKEIVINKEDFFFLSKRISDIFTYKAIIFSIIISLYLLIIILFPSIKDKNLFIYSIPIVIAQLLNPNWLLQGLENFKLITILNIASKTIYVVSIFIFVKHREDYVLANFLLGTSAILVYIVSFVYLSRKFKLQFTCENFKRGLSIIKTDFNICLSEFCLSIYQYFPILVVGFFAGNSAAGIYRVIEQVFNIFRTFIFMFFNFSFPTVCYEVQKNIKKGIHIWKLYHLGNFIIISIGCLFVYFFNDYILNFFHVAKNKMNYSSEILRIALIVPLLLVISQAFRQMMFALNLSKYYSIIIYFSCLTSIILLNSFVYLFGLKGSFISMIIIEVMVISLYSLFIYKNLKKL